MGILWQTLTYARNFMKIVSVGTLPLLSLVMLLGCSETPVVEQSPSYGTTSPKTIDQHLRGLYETQQRMFIGPDPASGDLQMGNLSDEFVEYVRGLTVRADSFKYAVFGPRTAVVTPSMLESANFDTINMGELEQLSKDVRAAFAQIMDLDVFEEFVAQSREMLIQHPQMRFVSKRELVAHMDRALGDRLQKEDCEGECWDDTWSSIFSLVGESLMYGAGCLAAGVLTLTVAGWMCVAGLVFWDIGQVWDIMDSHDDCMQACELNICIGKNSGPMCNTLLKKE